MSSPIHLIDAIRAALGERSLTTDPDRIAPFLTDWRGRFHGAAAAMLLPALIRRGWPLTRTFSKCVEAVADMIGVHIEARHAGATAGPAQRRNFTGDMLDGRTETGGLQWRQH